MGKVDFARLVSEFTGQTVVRPTRQGLVRCRGTRQANLLRSLFAAS